MQYVAGQPGYAFATVSGAAGLQDADTLPTGFLLRNGALSAVSVTVSLVSTGIYLLGWTTPGSWSTGDIGQLFLAATIGTFPTVALAQEYMVVAATSDLLGSYLAGSNAYAVVTFSGAEGLQDPDGSAVTGSLYHNGVVDGAVTVTPARVSTGVWTLSWTVPSTWALGDAGTVFASGGLDGFAVAVKAQDFFVGNSGGSGPTPPAPPVVPSVFVPGTPTAYPYRQALSWIIRFWVMNAAIPSINSALGHAYAAQGIPIPEWVSFANADVIIGDLRATDRPVICIMAGNEMDAQEATGTYWLTFRTIIKLKMPYAADDSPEDYELIRTVFADALRDVFTAGTAAFNLDPNAPYTAGIPGAPKWLPAGVRYTACVMTDAAQMQDEKEVDQVTVVRVYQVGHSASLSHTLQRADALTVSY